MKKILLFTSLITSLLCTNIPYYNKSNSINNAYEHEETELTTCDDNDNMTLEEFKQTIYKESDMYSELNFEQAFELMKTSLNNGDEISLTDAISISGGLTIPDNFMYDLSDATISGTLDTSKLNFDYANLILSMDESYNDINLSSQSIGAVSLFNSTYGNIVDQLKLTTPTIPEGFSMAELTTRNNEIINELYSSAYESGNYASIRNTIDISGIFNKASNGVDIYESQDADALSNSLDEIVKNYKENAQNKKNDSLNYIDSQLSDAASEQLETRNYVDSFYVDSNGTLVTPDTVVDESGNAINTNMIETFQQDAMEEIVNEHPMQVWADNWSDGDLEEYVDGDSDVSSQLLSGYNVEQWLDTVTGNNFTDTGEDLNPVEYIVTGQFGEDLYDFLH